MPHRSYQSQARSVRNDARETLLALRRARMEKRRALQQTRAGGQPTQALDSTWSAADTEAEAAFYPEAQVQDGPDTAAPFAGPEDMSSVMPAETAEPQVDAPASAEDPDPVAQEAEAPETEAAESDLATAPDTPALDSAPAEPEDAPEAETDPSLAAEVAASDLNQLPGAGVGLVWMLAQCGIHSLADLARADGDDLAQQMGLVGQILDLSHWITIAQECSASA